MNLSKLNNLLKSKVGAEWSELEIETVSLEIGALFDDLSTVKVAALKSLLAHPDITLNDADYLLRFVEIANGNLPDPHHHDIPTSLELDFAIQELETILGDRMTKTNTLSNVIRYIVNDEGHGKIASPTLAKYSGKEQVTTEFTNAYSMYATEMRGE